MQEYQKDTLPPFPLRIEWKVVAGPEFDPIQNIQCFDLIYDLQDLKDRKMYLDTENNPQFIDQIQEIKRHGRHPIRTNRTTD